MRLQDVVYVGFAVFLLGAAASCGQRMPISGSSGAGESSSGTQEESLRHIDLGVGYVPNVQFSPYYVAQSKGFYADEGLDVALEYGFENDFVALAGQGEREFAVASGDQVILSRAQGLPIVYIMKWYDRYPVGIVALTESGIRSPSDLEGRKVGIPGLYGASYAGWKALVYATGIDEAGVQLESIGFTQAEAVSRGQVDAAVVYLANEPIQLRAAGHEVTVIEVSDYIRLVSNGIVTSERVMNEEPALVESMVRATLRGIVYVTEHPNEAFEIARQNVPEMSDEAALVQRAVLEASLAQWGTDGVTQPVDWEDTLSVMLASGLVKAEMQTDAMFTNQFVK